jgi:hypothetical protein
MPMQMSCRCRSRCRSRTSLPGSDQGPMGLAESWAPNAPTIQTLITFHLRVESCDPTHFNSNVRTQRSHGTHSDAKRHTTTHTHTDTQTQRHTDTHRDSNPDNAQPKLEMPTTSETWAHCLLRASSANQVAKLASQPVRMPSLGTANLRPDWKCKRMCTSHLLALPVTEQSQTAKLASQPLTMPNPSRNTDDPFPYGSPFPARIASQTAKLASPPSHVSTQAR